MSYSLSQSLLPPVITHPATASRDARDAHRLTACSASSGRSHGHRSSSQPRFVITRSPLSIGHRSSNRRRIVANDCPRYVNLDHSRGNSHPRSRNAPCSSRNRLRRSPSAPIFFANRRPRNLKRAPRSSNKGPSSPNKRPFGTKPIHGDKITPKGLFPLQTSS